MKINRETIQLKGSELLAKVKEILEEGNASKISILDKDNKVLLEIPLTIGAGAGALGIIVSAPITVILVVVGAVSVILTNCSIIVEKGEKGEKIVDVAIQKNNCCNPENDQEINQKNNESSEVQNKTQKENDNKTDQK